MQNILLTINGGSSSIKFAIYEAAQPPNKLLLGQIQRVAQPNTSLSAKGLGGDVKDQPVKAADHGQAAAELIKFLNQRVGDRRLIGIGHRVVHGGFHLIDHCRIDEATLTQLRQATQLDSAHLPREISLIESFGNAFPQVPQVACFDTAFHKSLPLTSKMLPIPRKYFDQGIHRFGFHGLSYAYLMQELKKSAGESTANGRVILAHLGSGASMAALKNALPIDTTMSFTPIAGLMMGTRPGDLDPGLLVYLMRAEKLSADQLDDLLNKKCGLLGVSGSSADMRDLNNVRNNDPRAALAVDLFCYSATKQIGSYAAALGGLDTVVFSGGIGEHSPDTRKQICENLKFLGIEIDDEMNNNNSPIISKGQTVVRVIPTDEEQMIASITMRLTMDE